jgi:hypothetical protein
VPPQNSTVSSSFFLESAWNDVVLLKTHCFI